MSVVGRVLKRLEPASVDEKCRAVGFLSGVTLQC